MYPYLRQPIVGLLLTIASTMGFAQSMSEALVNQLATDSPATEAIWLGTGADEFLGLLHPATDLPVKLNLIVLHDQQQHPDWPGLIRSLRRDLPAQGWNTLSISLTFPDKPMTTTSSQITAATSHLSQYNPRPIIIAGLGGGATLAAAQAALWYSDRIAGLVLLDPAPLPGLTVADALVTLKPLRLPVLELVPERQPSSQQHPLLQSRGYQRRVLYGAGADFLGYETAVVKTIRGWAEKNQVAY